MSMPRDLMIRITMALFGAFAALGLAACNPAGEEATLPTAPPATALPAPATVPAYPGGSGSAEGGSSPAAGRPSASNPGPSEGMTETEEAGPTDEMTSTALSGSTDTGHDAGLSASRVGPSRGLADDPLSTNEIERAKQLALGTGEVRGMLEAAADRDGLLATSGRGMELGALLADRPTYRILYTQRAPEKESDKRMAEVAIYRYDTGEGSVSTIDLASGTVAEASLADDVYLPLVPAEIDEATQLARDDDQVKAALREAGLDEVRTSANGLLTTGTEDGSPCRRHRCVRLFFSTIDKPVPTFTATVDLVDLEVLEVSPIPIEGVNQ